MGFRLLLLLLLIWSVESVKAVEWGQQPVPGSRVTSFKPEITLSWPAGSSVPGYRQARLWLNDQEVSDELVRTAFFVSYRPSQPLQRGLQRVRVEVGEVARQWEFEVEGTRLITGCVVNAPSPLKPFQKVQVEVRGEVRAKGWAEIVGFPEKYTLKEKRGIYRAEFKAPFKLSGHDRQVEVFLQKGDQLDRQLCEGRLTMPAQDLSVSFTSPANGTSVEPIVKVVGQTLPDHEVELLVKPFFRDGVEFGNLPREIRKTTRSDEEGVFSIVYEFPQGLPRLGVRFLARVRDSADNFSQTAGLVLFLGQRGGLPPLRTEMPRP